MFKIKASDLGRQWHPWMQEQFLESSISRDEPQGPELSSRAARLSLDYCKPKGTGDLKLGSNCN